MPLEPEQDPYLAKEGYKVKANYKLVRELDNQDYVYQQKFFKVSVHSAAILRSLIDRHYNIELLIGIFVKKLIFLRSQRRGFRDCGIRFGI